MTVVGWSNRNQLSTTTGKRRAMDQDIIIFKDLVDMEWTVRKLEIRVQVDERNSKTIGIRVVLP